MNDHKVPLPTVMPVNREAWAQQINLSNFVNTYYQFKDLQSLRDCKKVLIIGPGQGLEKLILEWRRYDVTTFDIDQTFEPDYIGSVHDLSMFETKQFDAVVASHVLEHLAEPYLNPSLKEISRVGKYALIYLPVRGKHFQWRFRTGAGRVDFSFIFDLFNYYEKIDPMVPRYMMGQHFWEVGIRGFRVKDMKNRFSEFFSILKCYRNNDWIASINFILSSKYQDEKFSHDKRQ